MGQQNDSALLVVRDLAKTYAGADGPVDVLRGINLQVGAGETVALTGESGSGKSTVLHLVAGLDTPDRGDIRLAGQPVDTLDDAGRAALRRSVIGLVFQQFNLIPSLSVAANVAFQARLAGRYDPSVADGLMDRLGLAAQRDKYPEQLSGGQQQRVAIARALAVQPRLILADEPTGNLDEATAATVMDEMLALVSETGAALMMVTHSNTLAGRMGRWLRLQGGQIQ